MSTTVPALKTPVDSHDSFLVLLPAIQAHAKAAFGFLQSIHDREDAEAEVVARVWERIVTAPKSLMGSTDRLVLPAVDAVLSTLTHAHG